MVRKIVYLLICIFFTPFASLLFLLFLFTNFLGAIARKRVEENKLPRIDRATIIIPNWNGKELLAECLPSIKKALKRFGAESEVIVVDNNSSDSSVEFLRKNYPEIKVVESKTNLGFAQGCNLGVKNSKNGIVILLNNDMKVDEDFLSPLLAPFKDPGVFGVSSQIFFWDKKVRRQETGKTKGRFKHGFLEVGHEIPGKYDKLQPILYAGGGSSAYDKRKFLKLGGFDPLFEPFYGEDSDISYRAWKRGWKVLFEPQSIVYHKHRGTIGRTYSNAFINNIVRKNNILFVWKDIASISLIVQNLLCIQLQLLKDALLGIANFVPLLLALRQLPQALVQRLSQIRSSKMSDRQILRLLSSPFEYKELYQVPKPFEAALPMNILFLCPYFPYPPSHGGAVRMLNLIKELSKRHNIYLLSFVDANDRNEDVSFMKRFCKEVHVIKRENPRPDLNPFSTRSRFVGEFDSPNMWAKFLELLGSKDIDVVQVEYTQLAQYCPITKHAVTLLTEHDVSFLSFQRRFLVTKPLGLKLRALLNWLEVFNYELGVCQKFDTVLTVTRKEADFLQSYLPKTRISCDAPTGVDVEWFKRNTEKYVPDTLLYLGNFLHDPNVDAIIYFCKQIYPLIKAKVPGIRLTIAGRLPPKEVEALAKGDSVRVTGYVEDIRELYWRHAAFVVPIRFGAGVRVKILEAMAAGIPVVSTSIGCEGIEYIPGENILVGDTPKAFAQKTIEVLQNEELRKKLVSSSRKIVEERYDWKSIAQSLESVYYRLLAEKCPQKIVDST